MPVQATARRGPTHRVARRQRRVDAARSLRAAAALAAVLSGCAERIELLSDGGPAIPIDGGVPDAALPDGPPPDPVAEVGDDPFGDGTPFAYVVGFAGQVYLGPAADGAGAVRFNPDGSSPEVVAFEFPADTDGNESENGSPAPYPSVGRSGCASDTAECGPDNEDGRGLFASGVIGGTEYLVVGGARSDGDLDYVYVTPATTSPLAFRYVDLSDGQGPRTEGFSAMHVFAGRLYMGFPDTGGGRPFFHALTTAPDAPGLDAVEGSDFINLKGDDIPGLQTPDTAIIDCITDFGGLLYLANSGAWIRSANDTPRSADDFPEDWIVITPSAADYADKTSVPADKTSDIEPADKAVPQMAAFRGRLYAARNTTDGPQLWSCAPETTAPDAHCDPDDWTLVAANAVGDGSLTQFDNPNNATISMLVATPTHLYIGFDNAAEGVQVFRAAAPPSAAADFAAVGAPGLGNAGNTRIFDARALNLGGVNSVYVVAGSGASGVRVYRLL